MFPKWKIKSKTTIKKFLSIKVCGFTDVKIDSLQNFKVTDLNTNITTVPRDEIYIPL